MSSFFSQTPRVKYGIDPAPTPLNGDQPVDNLQDLIQRKREIQKNKSKFHLSEADCNLLLTNAREFHYKDQQVIVQEGQELPSVYRVKSGKVNIVKHGVTVSVISQVLYHFTQASSMLLPLLALLLHFFISLLTPTSPNCHWLGNNILSK